MARKTKEEKPKPDQTALLLRQIMKTNDRLMAAVLTVESFVELLGLGYVEGTQHAAQITLSGRKVVDEFWKS